MAESLEQIIERGGYVIHSVKGISMLPLLEQGKDLVKIVPATSPLKVGNVPLFKRPNGEYVLHRVVGVKKNVYLICGDNQNYIEKVPREWIIGVMEGFFKDGIYIPCTNENYQKYVKNTCKRLRLMRFRIFRFLHRLMHRKKHGKV